jgi:hypothetical protein
MPTPRTVPAAMRLILLPALEELFEPDEIDATLVSRVGTAADQSGHVNASDRRGIFAVVWIHGEKFEDLIIDDDAGTEVSESDLVNRLVENLQDFIAESRFGWGTQRPRGAPRAK